MEKQASSYEIWYNFTSDREIKRASEDEMADQQVNSKNENKYNIQNFNP